jgi:hypothetical protein
MILYIIICIIITFYFFNQREFFNNCISLKSYQKKLIDIPWQTPVITEKTVYKQNKKNPLYIGMPWATIIDKNLITHYEKKIRKLIKVNNINTKLNYITSCQHIHFRKLKKILSIMGIKTLYTSHKIKNENNLGNISLKPMMLYPVNIEDPSKNLYFKNKDFLNNDRKYLFSFIGAYQKNYLTDIRLQIFKYFSNNKNYYIKNTGEWHFNKNVYNKQIYNQKLNKKDIDNENKRTELYNKILINSRYSLCPSGSGPNSIRFWESLAVGSIPILLSDKLELPKHNLWKKAIIFVPECNISKIPSLLNNINLVEEYKMRKNCLKIYKDFKNKYI